MRPRARNRIITGALVFLLLLVLVGAFVSALEARAADAFRLEARAQPLGMATDRARDRYWLLDRASGRLTLTALASDGSVQGHMTSRDVLTNAQALAFDAGEAYVGDVGGRRSQVTIYQVTEPWPGTEILRAIPYALTYPDGPHDAAAILVDASHRLHVVTKGPDAAIYQAPANPSRREPNPLTRIASAPGGVTDAVVLHDGRLVLRTATHVYALDPATHATLGEAEIGVEERGQTVTEGIVEGELITAAGAQGLVSSMAVPGPAPAEPAPERPTRGPVAQTQADPEATRTFEQPGTAVAVVAALVVAALAAIAVLLRR